MAIKKEETKAFTVKFPKSLVEEIDQICSTLYIPRTSWLIKAARALLDQERMSRTDEILAKISDKENN
jgi:metal-responsive CopG/Arc/MetJ family transcriptional regulator